MKFHGQVGSLPLAANWISESRIREQDKLIEQLERFSGLTCVDLTQQAMLRSDYFLMDTIQWMVSSRSRHSRSYKDYNLQVLVINFNVKNV